MAAPRRTVWKIDEVCFVDSAGQVWEPRAYTLDTADDVRLMVADALYSFSRGQIPRDTYNAVIAAAGVALKTLEVAGAQVTVSNILYELSLEQPDGSGVQ